MVAPPSGHGELSVVATAHYPLKALPCDFKNRLQQLADDHGDTPNACHLGILIIQAMEHGCLWSIGRPVVPEVLNYRITIPEYPTWERIEVQFGLFVAISKRDHPLVVVKFSDRGPEVFEYNRLKHAPLYDGIQTAIEIYGEAPASSPEPYVITIPAA